MSYRYCEKDESSVDEDDICTECPYQNDNSGNCEWAYISEEELQDRQDKQNRADIINDNHWREK
jgi:hypothetical protein